MKLVRLTILYLIVVSLVACATPPSTPAPMPNNSMVTVPPTLQAMPAKTQDNVGDETEETQIKALVENFGKRLQNVSLLAPDAGRQLEQQYSEYVSPALLEAWSNNVAAAPGRMVSSPWPDRIEITALEKINADQFVVTGSIIEVTSPEMVSGEAANRIPIHIVVEKTQVRWLITEFTQEG